MADEPAAADGSDPQAETCDQPMIPPAHHRGCPCPAEKAGIDETQRPGEGPTEEALRAFDRVWRALEPLP
jgi:hypothetical protein